MKSNITDVAERAGVSIATVSRVLKDNYPVSEKTREKVLRAVEELNYTPHFIASSLKSKQVNLIGVVLPSLKNNVIMSVAESIATEAETHGYMTLFACSENDEKLERIILNLFRSSLVDGVVAVTVFKDASIFEELESINIPVVLFDRSVGNIDWVGEDCYSASYDMVKYIISKGHRRIAFLKGVEGITISSERYNGYLDAMRDAGLEILPQWQLQCDYREDKAYGIVSHMLRVTPREEYPTAIFSANSIMAKGAINAILERNLRIAKDISVAAYGDLDLPRNMRPRIACIQQNTTEIGKRISEMMMRRLKEKNSAKKNSEPERVIVPVTIFKGDSVFDLNKKHS